MPHGNLRTSPRKVLYMAELLDNQSILKHALLAYARGIAQGEITREHFETYATYLHQAGPWEVNWLVDQLVQEVPDLTQLKGVVSKCIKACGKGLDRVELPNYPAGSIFAHLTEQNQQLAKEFQGLSPMIKAWFKGEPELDAESSIQPLMAQALNSTPNQPHLIPALKNLIQLLEHHYQILQNELFPKLESTSQDYRCVQLMWSIQDDVLANGKMVIKLMESWTPEHRDLWNQTLGTFSVDARSLLYREERILLPVVYRSAGWGEDQSTLQQSNQGESAMFNSTTGTLNHNQLEALVKTLPMDMTFVDHEDRVRFFSESPHRIFPRSTGILGRKVENCHPPKSLDRVVQIVADLKAGKKDLVQFWMDYRGRKVLIEYRALRDQEGRYLGILETTQDITQIQTLKGEKRLEE
jgi:PAS domain S-box-containing protein